MLRRGDCNILSINRRAPSCQTRKVESSACRSCLPCLPGFLLSLHRRKVAEAMSEHHDSSFGGSSDGGKAAYALVDARSSFSLRPVSTLSSCIGGSSIRVNTMAGQVRQPVDLQSFERWIDKNVPEIETPLELKQVRRMLSSIF